jgi:integrative and conjugative element protein (TIGR02256 family)
MNERRFQLPDNRGTVTFSVEVLKHMYKYAQTSFWSTEAGGQLFSMNPEQSSVQISLATGPYQQDLRTRWQFSPNIQKATEDRFQQFTKGLHSVGLWHTHPEAYPTPSISDQNTTKKYLDYFQGDMDGYVLAILGNKGEPLSLTLWIAWITKSKNWEQVHEILY